jgi:hypothetical protein
MEESLGAPLLERHRRGVNATPAGAALVHHAQLVVQQLERMRGISTSRSSANGKVSRMASVNWQNNWTVTQRRDHPIRYPLAPSERCATDDDGTGRTPRRCCQAAPHRLAAGSDVTRPKQARGAPEESSILAASWSR